MYFDEEKQSNRALRYASNYPSPFEDEQKENAITPIISFENGFLFVPKALIALQKLLELHPYKGIIFDEVDVEKEAKDENAKFDIEVEALLAARNMSVKQMEDVVRVVFGKDPASMKSEVMKREILRFAKANPDDFLKHCSSPENEYESQIRSYFDLNLLSFRREKKEVWFNTSGNKSRMLVVPFGANPYELVGAFLKSDEGIEFLKVLETEKEAN